MPKQHQCQNSTITDADLAHELMPKEHTHKAIKTIKQYIPENQKKRTSKTLIPNDFSVSERVKVWAEKNGYKNLDVHLENFILAANAKAYTYADWDSAFMGAIRNNWAKVQPDSDKSKKPDWLKV